MDSSPQSQLDPPSTLAPGKICPYLGKYNDPATCYGYPNLRNRCHHARPPQHILLDYQANVCLGGAGAYQACPIYLKDWKGPFPPEIRGVVQTPRRPWVLWLGVLAAILLLLALLYVFVFRRANSNTSIREMQTPVAGFLVEATSTIQSQPATATLTSTFIPPTTTSTTMVPTLTATQTYTPHPTTSPTPGQPTSGPLEETPFGTGGHYLVHIVKEGDTLESLAKSHNTTIDVLKAINMAPPQNGLWVGIPTIIITGEKDLTKVIPLKAVWLAERAQVLELRQKYNTPTEEFRTLNALGPGNWVEGGRWLIVYR